ncbi:hypothetical protein ENU1_211130 [Entamoeba nuttalli P19]|uniref:Uncharacterized protein n=2 Tax=Entamoeba nuttalli TaxID=412467 RepID=K2HMK6_ENTNP|nr:hypothetical protein ENU1_211130 [Entamoeba nuttalli P19]EKE37050.1 hypothetical protein ENU1_211130 [Entamoeba nuttalli P19]|eukprot:XP_008860616.1 hypothetical protein ENU1_211130 [Entamoeba nuttalli P19]
MQLSITHNLFVISSFLRIFATLTIVLLPSYYMLIFFFYSFSILSLVFSYSLEITTTHLKRLFILWGFSLSILLMIYGIYHSFPFNKIIFSIFKYCLLVLSSVFGSLLLYYLPNQYLHSNDSSVPFFESETSDLSLLVNDD